MNMISHNSFDSLEAMIVAAAEGVRPPERLFVDQAAVKYRKLNNVGGYVGPWRNETTPYLVEPMRELTNDLYSTVCFIGPAQCGKTDMYLNYLAYTVVCDPADLMLVQTVQATARDFSITRVDRMHRASPEVGMRMLPTRDADNVFDKRYRSGMIQRFAWPSINELSGRPVPRIWLTDYDRMTMDVDGEGTPYYLANVRTTSFRRLGKTVVETSPGFPVNNPQWVPKSRHEAPPCEGGLSIYNGGDKRRWFWQCVKCKQSFEPHRSVMRWPNSEDPMECGEGAWLECPHCQQHYHETETPDAPGKYGMNQLVEWGGQARWLKDGQIWTPDGLHGKGARSTTASFWLMGVAAAFSTWSDLVSSLVKAEKEYEDTTVELSLKSVINTKWGEAYVPKAMQEARIPEQLRSRAKDYGHKMVPHGVRFLVATIDVQKNRFIVQIHGIGTDDIWVIDRFEVKYSKRPQEDNPGQLHWVNPGAHQEDWRLLVTEVMTKTYPLMDDPERHMAIYQTFCDSGGKEGVTTNAYDFVRWLRWGYENTEETQEMQDMYPWFPHLAARFQLTKGSPLPNDPRVRLGYPDSERKDRHAGARGEIPVLFINSNVMKDTLNGILDRTEPGGRINFANWLPVNFYKELTVEVKDPKTGKWENPHKYRNESWDLLVYCLAGLLHRTIGWEHIDWSDPPTWATEWDSNDMVFRVNDDILPFDAEDDDTADLEALGELLG